MPLKKNSKTRTSTVAKSKRNSIFKNDKVGPGTAPLVTALKENNRCLATALDESRHEYRALQESFLKLQQERQKLLEKVASLENQLIKQDYQLFAIHVQPSLQLLYQAEKDIKYAKEYLKRLFVPTTTADTVTSSAPEFLSPIRECQGGKKHKDIPSSVRIASEADIRQPNEKPKAVYPKTPHPAASLKSPQLSSTPLDDESEGQSPILLCSPRAINFEESLLLKRNSNDGTARKTSAELMGSRKARKVSLTEGSRAGAKENSVATVVSPGMPESENQRDESAALPELDDLHRELNATELSLLQRPRRRCTSLNVSYQEPSLNRKLRRGDPFTSENMGFPNSERAKGKSHHKSHKPIRATLTDVTNKK